ncbi:3'(2'),5'-bisphosphate nucleotidase CysQ [Pseudidiomarina terrestris]|uniref:3'(2'),5'-bisphosphate nucleotidase CysQ n=1 Tax=Pseudidiomarina terrestris TaxID=2820060 RepID=UPI00264F2C1A|nr:MULTISPECIES: 3'(2'),5'-bisphosphate nucleotidase CysQ [unclassified Pseudidiomarina]MDN7126217.1 3'(2'),5'-bisphosphate nucleotidase CysQ [Pseudidiomarina sp. 1APR75-33.1]MDN7134242.1 3'(2'),5'-bisphosphate nucleotidase CysQ [Pseudidiomarina sp. 1ASP75-5]MDN7137070.1 3'(2'),5'-bisphosphate nucleotidase CysQ [Pseudidiomarina sp. 1ASP75-14]MEA3588329.1 3'(2'),5'-bisphosphate nucleotidase CysQ [Pseudidiomarina sp. 1APP75-27a]
MTPTKQLQQWLEGAADVALQAGDLIMELYEEQAYATYEKSDSSPVTSADLAAHKFITDQLKTLTPDIPVLSEEGAHLSLAERQAWQRYWLIDPIDGTQEFIARSGDFTVVIALVEQHQPTLGVIYWPAGDKLYLAQKDRGAFRRDINGEQRLRVHKFSNPEQDPLRLAISRRQPRERVLQRMNPDREISTVPAGSCSLKACLIAEGQADCFLRVGPTGEWDTAAADVIVGEAGGSIVSEHFKPITYNKEADLGNPNFVILGDEAVNWRNVFIRHQTHPEA